MQGFGPERIMVGQPSDGEPIAFGLHAFSAPRDGVEVRLQVYAEGERLIDRTTELAGGQFWFALRTIGAELLDEVDSVSDGFP